jgi:hypothetical protein
MTSTRYQLNPVPFTEEYRLDLLGDVAVSYGKGNCTGKNPRPNGKWKSPLFPTAPGTTPCLAACPK